MYGLRAPTPDDLQAVAGRLRAGRAGGAGHRRGVGRRPPPAQPSYRFRHAINARDGRGGDAARPRPAAGAALPVHADRHPCRAGRGPDGIRIEPPDDDLSAVHAVLTEAFAEDCGYHPAPLDRWVNELGVRRSHRGRGIAAAMLRRSFATFADRGLGRVLLNVDSENPIGATAFYERVGMRVVWRWDLWERRGSRA